MSSKSKELMDLEFYYEIVTSKPPLHLHSTCCLSPMANRQDADVYEDEDLDNAFENDEYNLYNFKEKTQEVALIEVNDKENHCATTTTTTTTTTTSSTAISRPPVLFQSVLNEVPEHDQQNTKNAVETEIEVPKPTLTQIPTKIQPIKELSEYYYFYASWEKCYEIFSNRCINLEKIFHDRQLIEGIILLTVPPTASDNEILLEYFGSSVPIDKKQIECYIRFRREVLDANKQFLAKIGENKYLCKRKILFESNRLPKHQFRSKYQN